jgi:RNA polymerase sigma-70 factor (ECF subfamily)
MNELNLAGILQGCLRHDRRAQKDLYVLYYGYAMSISLRYVNDEDDAINVTNDAFLKVYKNLRQYNPDQPFKPWFRRILINTAINYLRKMHQLPMEQIKPHVFEFPDTDDILAKIGFDELMNMIRSLSVAYRTVFNLYIIDGFSHEEISRELGIAVGTSKANLSKARESLRNMILKQLNV